MPRRNVEFFEIVGHLAEKRFVLMTQCRQLELALHVALEQISEFPQPLGASGLEGANRHECLAG